MVDVSNLPPEAVFQAAALGNDTAVFFLFGGNEADIRRNIERQDSNGWTVLHHATANGHEEVRIIS